MKLKSLAASLMCCMATSAFAVDFEVNGIYYNIISDSEVEVTYYFNNGYKDYVGDIVIPETVTCTTYSSSPFKVTTIGKGAFEGCSNLTSIVIPNSVTTIKKDSFFRCVSLTSIEIPNSVTSISNEAFGGCNSLASIRVDEANPVYDSYENCNSIIKTTTGTLIAGCKNSTIPNGVTAIGAFAFYINSSLTSIEIPNSVTSIGQSAFEGCSSLTSIEIPNSVTSIGYFAFYDCRGLKSVEIPNGITVLHEGVLRRCSSLKTITIPESVTSIEWEAMADCSALEHIYNHAKTPADCSEDVFKNVPIENCVLHVPAGCVEAYQAAVGWKDFVNIVDDAAGIEDITTADAPAEYFDLRGMKVTAPTNGIFIKKQGNTTSKVLL